MPQRHLPLFPQGVTHITAELAFLKKDNRVTYFNGHMPVFIHAEDDRPTFRMITGQFCVNGNAKQADIVRAFGVTTISVKRSVKLYREKGPAGLYAPRSPRGPSVLTEPVVAEIEEFLDAGMSEAEIAERLGLKRDTLRKAVRAGRIHVPTKKILYVFAPPHPPPHHHAQPTQESMIGCQRALNVLPLKGRLLP